MEGFLARWVLALQEYQFQIVYRKGALHGSCVSVWLYDILHCCCGLVLLRIMSAYLRGTLHKHTVLALLSYLLSFFTMAISQGSTAEC